MGLDVYLYHGSERIELPSKLHPDHLFKIGYWRSSYNEGGINRVLEVAIGKTLYDLAEDMGKDDYTLTGNWEHRLWVAQTMRYDFDAWINSDAANYAVDTVYQFTTSAQVQTGPKMAMKTFLEQKNKDRVFSSYSCREGRFDFGDAPHSLRGLMVGRECCYVVYDVKPKDQWQWYLDALDIVIETLEYVVADGGDFEMAWSG